jgi:glycosyltransferase involved in cell wall biosynthesis
MINMFHHTQKTVVFFHGWDQFLVEIIRRNAFWNRLIRFIYKRVSIIVVLFNSCREQLSELGFDPTKIKVETTMYATYWNPKEREQLLKEKNTQKKTILFMSRFVSEKGVFIAADVARFLVQNRHNEFRFIFAGEGPELANLKSYISNHGLEGYIDVPGFISGETKKEILAKSDIFLFPTLCQEGCPVVILEAMGAGLAIVSTPAGAIPYIVEHNENGFIIDSKDPEDFYQAINKLILERDLLQSFQRANRKKAEENFEAKFVTQKMESLYLFITNA